MASPSKEIRILLALEALKDPKEPSIRSIAKIYNIDQSTLYRRQHGQPARRDILPKVRKLTELEEEVLVRYILKLALRAFPPRLSAVEEMANRLLTERDAGTVGKNWVANFVKRRPELKGRWTRKYDYQRAKCEDPEIISGWFRLVRNFMSLHGIVEDDVYNFDETGFLMGMISSTLVVTTSEGRGKAKLVQPGNLRMGDSDPRSQFSRVDNPTFYHSERPIPPCKLVFRD